MIPTMGPSATKAPMEAIKAMTTADAFRAVGIHPSDPADKRGSGVDEWTY